MPQQVHETAAITEAAAAEAKRSGRMLIQFISPGWGSSGYYSPEVLEQAALDGVIPAGTHMYADHPTEAEDIERPVRSIKDLMAITTEAAYVGEGGALVGEVQVVPAWRDLVETVKDSIGVSIRGSATDLVEGEAEGRKGRIVEGLVAPVMSVDFVTRAGRGGKVLQVLESAAANRRAIDRGIEEATVNDTREALQTALRDAHATAKDTWLWVRDFDDTTVWFELEGSGAGDAAGIYGQAYTEIDGAVTLTGDRTEVRVVTKYVPATRPDSTTTATQESEEDTMPNIEESELARLREDAGRVTALEERATTAEERATIAEAALAERDRTDAARRIIDAQEGVTFSTLEIRGLLADLPLTEAGDFDEAAFTATVEAQVQEAREAHARTLEEAGHGRIRGFGGPTSTTATGTEEQQLREASDAARATAFGRTVKEA